MKLFDLATIRCDEVGCLAVGQVQVRVIEGIAWFPEHPGGWLLTDEKDYCPKHLPKVQVEEVGA